MEEQETRRDAEVEQAGGDEEAELEGEEMMGRARNATVDMTESDVDEEEQEQAWKHRVMESQEARRRVAKRSAEFSSPSSCSLQEQLDEVEVQDTSRAEQRSRAEKRAMAEIWGDDLIASGSKDLDKEGEDPEVRAQRKHIALSVLLFRKTERLEKQVAALDTELSSLKVRVTTLETPDKMPDKAEEERAGEDAGAAGSAELARREGARADEDEEAEMIGHAKKATVDMTGSHWDRRYRSDESQRRRDVERPRERTRSRTTKAEKRAR